MRTAVQKLSWVTLTLVAGVGLAQAGLPEAPPDPPEVQLPGVSEAKTNQMVRWIVAEAGRLSQPACWRPKQANTAGRPLRNCPKGQQNNAGLCFTDCPPGHSGVGPLCLADCAPGFTPGGPVCLKPKGYARRAYPWVLGDLAFDMKPAKRRCKAAHGDCQRQGDVFYPRCKPGYRGDGGNCVPRCPPGSKDVGPSCERKSVTRPARQIAKCSAGEVEKLGRCFPQCPDGWAHGGPFCTKQCGPGHPVECGDMCAHSTAKCVGEVAKMVLASAEVVANIAGLALTGGSANVALKSATTAAKAGSKIAAKAALKTAVSIAAKKIAEKLTKRVGAKVLAFATRKAGRGSSKELAKAYSRMVMRKAAKKIALTHASQIPSLREIATMIDPTGIAGVINAFDKPLCVPKRMPK